MTTETEFKFESLANIQFKYSLIESGDSFMNKIKSLCELLDISIGQAADASIEDIYYDDASKTLFKNHLSFRTRRKAGTTLITIKYDSPPDAYHQPEALSRLEHEEPCTVSQIKDLLNNSGEFSAKIKNTIGVEVHPGKVEKLLMIINNRTAATLNTGANKYEICYDKYYYQDFLTGGYSRYFSEIEIENKGKETGVPDKQLAKLRRALETLFNYDAHRDSKLKRGFELLSKPISNFQVVYSVAFDIIDFSLKSDDVQLQLVQKLNHIVKEGVLKFREKAGDVVYLPTGDGMILCFENQPETLFDLVIFVHEETRKYNEQQKKKIQEDRCLLFRTGMHTGHAFKFSDVNENLNYAGTGINLAARAMALGNQWHILATKEIRDVLVGIKTENSKFFHDLGEHRVKHGVSLHIYNVFDIDTGFGCAESL